MYEPINDDKKYGIGEYIGGATLLAPGVAITGAFKVEYVLNIYLIFFECLIFFKPSSTLLEFTVLQEICMKKYFA